MIPYAGIGSRETPSDVIDNMVAIAILLRSKGYRLRSGGAKGADSAFALGAQGDAEIFKAKDATIEAIQLARTFHPAWEKCSEYARQLHGRNSMIILGEDLITPARFVLCWTYPGNTRGGTVLGMNIAKQYGIPVHNLAEEEFSEEWLAA